MWRTGQLRNSMRTMVIACLLAIGFAHSISASPLGQAGQNPMAPEFNPNLEWLNTDRPLTLKEFKGKVVILDFWTYGCINCMHIIPDLKKLERKYGSSLVVIGVHSAKFANEKESGNILNAILQHDIEHPVVNDKDFLTWRAYGVDAWPTVFLIDPDGRVVGYKSGEGVYEPFDAAIAKLIAAFEAKGKINKKPVHFVLEKEHRPKSPLSYPSKIAIDVKTDRMFVSDMNHNRIVVMSTSGTVQDVIGDGSTGLKDGGYSDAKFSRPRGVYFDGPTNTLYVTDTENHALRSIDLTAKKVTTLAGDGNQADWPPMGGPGKTTRLSSPWDLVKVGDRLYIAMAGTHQLWYYDLKTKQALPYAGGRGENLVDGPLTSALLAQPSGIAYDGTNLIFADSEASGIRTASLAADGEVKTIIGVGLFEFGDVDGKYPSARLQHPLGVAVKGDFIYVADTYNNKIRRIDPKTKEVTTYIGTGKPSLADGTAKSAGLREPAGLAFDGDKLFIADMSNNVIRVFDTKTSTISTLVLSNIEKLLPKQTVGAPLSPVRTLKAVEIAPGTKTLEFSITLPKGTKFNKAAPFMLKVTSANGEVVTMAAFTSKTAAPTISIPIDSKLGKTDLKIELMVNYCNTGNEGLCFFKDVRLEVPVTVKGGGSATLAVNYAP
ncbi:MAG: thioredoxin-like domain-containing protein [Chthonomonadales bacterium]